MCSILHLTSLSDLAIFMMSLHMSFQVFNPSTSHMGPDGLYRYRWAVYACFIVLPAFDAALAFTNSGNAYLAQGALCTLPIRPFWYRLALSWIPRYLIWAYVVFIAIRIYMHVGSGFKVFAHHDGGSSSTRGNSGGATDDQTGNNNTAVDVSSKRLLSAKLRPSSNVSNQIKSQDLPELPPFVSDTNPAGSRRPSFVRWDSGTIKFFAREHDRDQDTESGPSSRRGSHKDSDGSDETCAESLSTSHSAQKRTSHMSLAANPDDFPLPTIVETNNPRQPSQSQQSQPHSQRQLSAPLAAFDSSADQILFERKRAIQRQVRLLFIYPVVYMMFMVIPFVFHAMMYNDYYAQHRPYSLTMLNTLCYAVMGTVDCVIFCWREKPWALLPGSDGTFTGSFCFWRFAFPDRFYGGNWTGSSTAVAVVDMQDLSSSTAADASATDDNGQGQGRGFGFMTNLRTKPPPTHRRVFSGQGERATLAAERAAERLALERLAAAQERDAAWRSASIVQANAMAGGVGPSRQGSVLVSRDAKPREWFDRQESWELEDEESDEEEEESKGMGKQDGGTVEVARTIEGADGVAEGNDDKRRSRDVGTAL